MDASSIEHSPRAGTFIALALAAAIGAGATAGAYQTLGASSHAAQPKPAQHEKSERIKNRATPVKPPAAAWNSASDTCRADGAMYAC